MTLLKIYSFLGFHTFTATIGPYLWLIFFNRLAVVACFLNRSSMKCVLKRVLVFLTWLSFFYVILPVLFLESISKRNFFDIYFLSHDFLL